MLLRVFVLHLVSLFVAVHIGSAAGQDGESHLVAQISTVPYDDNLNKGGLSFETKHGSEALQRRLLISSDGRVGVNIPDEHDPSAMLDVRGDILARNGTMSDLFVTHSITAHNNISGHHIQCSSLGVEEVLTTSTAKVLNHLDAATVSTGTLQTTTCTVSGHHIAETSESGSVLVHNTLNASVIGADVIESRRIASTGIRMHEEWPLLNGKMCSGPTVPVSLERMLQTLGGCQAACLADERCAAAIWDSARAACSKKQDVCTVVQTNSGAARTYIRPTASQLDISSELAAAKVEILRQNAKIAALDDRLARLEDRMATLLGDKLDSTTALHAVAFMGQYDALDNPPSLNQLAGLSGKLSHTNLVDVPAASKIVGVSELYLSKSNSVHTDEKDDSDTPKQWPTVANHACFIAGEWDRNSEGKEERCQIKQHNARWVLEAASDPPQGTWCWMRCIEWRDAA